jgi:hypothetical protein
MLPAEAGARLGGGSSFHFLSNVIAGACARLLAAAPRLRRTACGCGELCRRGSPAF